MRGFMVAMTSDRPRPEGFNHPAHILTALRPTLDQHVAKHTPFYDTLPARYRSLVLGVSRARFHDYGHWNAISYNGPGSLNQPILEAARLYDALFAVPDDAAALLGVGDAKADEKLPRPELAAWTMVCSQLLNLDEILNK